MDVEKISKRLSELDIPSLLQQTTELKEIKLYLERVTENINIWNSVMLRFFNFEKDQQQVPSTSLTLRERAMVQLLNILYSTEGGLGGVINLIAFALILRGHNDLRSQPKRKFVSEFNGLLEAQLSDKLKLLRKHGFGSISDFCPKDLRNAIAHQSFAIDVQGTVHVFRRGHVKEYSFKESVESQ